jgi:hypothetical protein
MSSSALELSTLCRYPRVRNIKRQREPLANHQHATVNRTHIAFASSTFIVAEPYVFLNFKETIWEKLPADLEQARRWLPIQLVYLDAANRHPVYGRCSYGRDHPEIGRKNKSPDAASKSGILMIR